MSKLVHNYNGGRTDEYATDLAISRFMIGDVIEGLQVVPNSTPNMTIKVNPGSGRITAGAYPSSYGYFFSHDTTGGESVTIATAAASPRIDYIVAYIDKTVSGSTGVTNNTNNVLKFAAVTGTPAGSPVVPTTSQIQAAIGAANPYIILAQIAVAASVTTITTPNISDKRVTATINGTASLQTYTNPGGGGGSWSYVNIGGMKILMGSFAGVATGSVAQLIYPVGFFTATPITKTFTPGPVAGTNAVYHWISSETSTSISVGLTALSGSGTMPIQGIVIGL